MKTGDPRVPARVIVTVRQGRRILPGERWAWSLVVGRELPSQRDDHGRLRELIIMCLMDLRVRSDLVVGHIRASTAWDNEYGLLGGVRFYRNLFGRHKFLRPDCRDWMVTARLV